MPEYYEVKALSDWQRRAPYAAVTWSLIYASLWVVIDAVLKLQTQPRLERGVSPVETSNQKGTSS